MLSSGYYVTGVIMNMQHLQPPTQDLNKTKHDSMRPTNWEEENQQPREGDNAG